MSRRSEILMELSPDELLSMTGELDSFDRGGRIKIYHLCTLFSQRMRQ